MKQPTRQRFFALLFVAVLLALFGGGTLAQDEFEEEATGTALEGRPIYIPLKPPFVVNYGGEGRLRYLKTEISVRVSDVRAANSIRHHMPYIRNNLVLLFSRQKEEDIDTQEGKELVRQAALEEIRGIIEAEDSVSGVVDLYFNNFIVQK